MGALAFIAMPMTYLRYVCVGSTIASSFAAVAMASPCSQALCQSREDAGVALIQTKPASVEHEGATGIGMEEQLEVCEVQTSELTRELQELRQKLKDVESRCNRASARSGVCAVFGDPHFTTFDGAHTILLAQKTLWVVKSQKVWIQALSREASGDLMGLAVSGPFMDGHTLIFANTSKATPTHPFTVLFNDKPILDDVTSDGHADFRFRNITSASRRSSWDLLFHDASILRIDDAIEYDFGSWSSRFSGQPKGGLYSFKFPEGVELTATGSDLMSAVLRMMPQEGGQSGYCGNFNGDARDEFEAPAEGTVAEVLVPAWNIPVGDGLEQVPDSLDLFKTSAALQKLLSKAPLDEVSTVTAAPEASGQPCREDMLAKAESACSKFTEQPALHAACLSDVCRSGDASAADGILAVGVLDGEMAKRTIA